MFDRNQIVVLGPRTVGKTIYLATLYGQLYRSPGGFNGKAVTGQTHLHLMNVYEKLRLGEWPGSTTADAKTLQVQIEHNGTQHFLASLDFSGELFTKTFLDEDASESLLKHIDSAKAVMLLIDPATFTEKDEFAMAQAVQRVRDSLGGDRVPIVLLLTKYDENRELVKSHGDAVQFIRMRLPSLTRELKSAKIFCVSCVQLVNGRPSIHPVNVVEALDACLSASAENDLAAYQKVEKQIEKQKETLAQMREHKENYALIFVIVSIFVIGAVILLLLLRYGWLRI